MKLTTKLNILLFFIMILYSCSSSPKSQVENIADGIEVSYETGPKIGQNQILTFWIENQTQFCLSFPRDYGIKIFSKTKKKGKQMKLKLLLFAVILTASWITYSGFSGGDNDPRWNQDPRTVVNLSGDYKPLPTVYSEIKQFTTEPQTTITPIGVMVTYPNVRVHPSATNDFSQSEVPIVSSPARIHLPGLLEGFCIACDGISGN